MTKNLDLQDLIGGFFALIVLYFLFQALSPILNDMDPFVVIMMWMTAAAIVIAFVIALVDKIRGLF